MRQFIIDSEPDSNGLVYLDGKDFKYIRQVLRLRVGDMLKLSYGESVVNSTVCFIDDKKKKITLQLCGADEQNGQNENSSLCPEFWLLQFIPKPQKMELIIRQAVETGVRTVIPVTGEYTQRGSEKCLCRKADDAGGNQNRISRIIKEARQQSGSPVETEVLEPLSLKDAVERVGRKLSELKRGNNESVLVALYERNEDSRTMIETVFEKIKNAEVKFGVIAVGSEGGISPSEIQLLKNSGFTTVHFDANIMRCETASLYGMACLQTAIREGTKWLSKE